MKKITAVFLLIIIVATTLWLYACASGSIAGEVMSKQEYRNEWRIELAGARTIGVTQGVYAAVVVGNHYEFSREGATGDYDAVRVMKIVVGE